MNIQNPTRQDGVKVSKHERDEMVRSVFDDLISSQESDDYMSYATGDTLIFGTKHVECGQTYIEIYDCAVRRSSIYNTDGTKIC